MTRLAKDVERLLEQRSQSGTTTPLEDQAIRDRLADSLLREATGFLDRSSARTQRHGRLPPAVREWVRGIQSKTTAASLPSGHSVVVGDGRWAACVIGYLGDSEPRVMSFAFWLLTSADSRACGGASLDLTNEDDPYWGFWIQ